MCDSPQRARCATLLREHDVLYGAQTRLMATWCCRGVYPTGCDPKAWKDARRTRPVRVLTDASSLAPSRRC
eukprot:1876316-Prymnesium_polylepis.1